MRCSSDSIPSMKTGGKPRTLAGSNDLVQVAEQFIVFALIACGAALVVVPLLLTLYLSVFDEKLILFPPRGYTLTWYPAILPNFGSDIVTSLALGADAVV